MPDTLIRSLASLTRHMPACLGADGDLVARYVSGHDESSFTELVRRHGPLVLGVCRRMLGHAHDADDAYQATFLILARRARSIHKPNALSAWLYGTAVRVCKNALAKRGRRPVAVPTQSSSDPAADLAWKEVCGLLDEELSRLPEALRDPLILCYFNGLTRDEAAERLGWSRRTLMRRLEQGRERLRLRLTRRGVATLGLAAVVMSPAGLAARVPAELAEAAVRLGAGGPVSAAVCGLVGGFSTKLMSLAVGFTLIAVVCGFGFFASGLQVPEQVSPENPAKPDAPRLDQPKVDADGQKLPAEAVRRLGSRKFRVNGRSQFILPTPDGKHILIQPQPSISGYAARGLLLLDADTGVHVRTFEESRRVPMVSVIEAIRPAAFSPDGKKLYALGWHKSEETKNGISYMYADLHQMSKRVLLVWDVATGKKTAEWDVGGASMIGVTVSPDGKRLFVYGIPGLLIHDAATGEYLENWSDAGFPVGWTDIGKTLITYRKGEITAIDSKTGKKVRTYPIAGNVPSVALSADGKTLAAVVTSGEGDQRTGKIKLWEAVTGKQIRELAADPKTLGHRARLVFAADGKTLYLGTGSGHILHWDLAKGETLRDWPAHSGIVADLFLRPGKNELVSAGAWDGTIRRWDSATGKALSTSDAYVGNLAVAQTPDRRVIAIGDRTGRVDLWDLSIGRAKSKLQLPEDVRRSLTFSPDSQSLLDATDDGKITIWNVTTGRPVRQITAVAERQGEENGGWCTLTFSPDGRHLLTSRYGYGTRLFTWPACDLVWQKADSCIAVFSPDSARMISGDWGNSRPHFRDPNTGDHLAELNGMGLMCAAFSPFGERLVTTHLYYESPNAQGAWQVRNAVNGAVLKEIKEFRWAWSFAFSPSGWLLAVACDNSVRVFDTASWQEVARYDGHDATVDNVCFGKDDATLISSSAEEGTALVWSLKTSAGPQPPDPAKLWADLVGEGPAVRRAVWAAAQHPEQAIKLFRDKWPIPSKPDDPKLVAKLIGDLDSATFEDREAAKAALEKMGRRVEAELKKTAEETSSAEVKRRIELILARLAGPEAADYSAEEAREFRAVWALELAGTPEAQKLLKEWSVGKVGIRLGAASTAALKRLDRNK